MLRDRGTIKWTSLMLPEHVHMLKSLWREQALPSRPSLDPQEQERLNRAIIEAAVTKDLINIVVFANQEYTALTGTIVSIHEITGCFDFKPLEGSQMSISVHNIIDVDTSDTF